MTARFYVARSQIWGTWPLASSCPSLRMYRGRSPFWRGRGLSLKYLEKIQVWLIPDKNMGHLRWTAKHVWYCWQLHTQLNNTNDNSLLRFQSNAFNIRVSFSWKSSSYVCFFPPGATQSIVGVYFTALYRALVSSCTRLLHHTQGRATVGRTPLNEWLVRRRDLYQTTHNTQNRQISMPQVGFESTIAAGERP